MVMVTPRRPSRGCPKWLKQLCFLTLAFWAAITLFESYFSTDMMMAIRVENHMMELEEASYYFPPEDAQQSSTTDSSTGASEMDSVEDHIQTKRMRKKQNQLTGESPSIPMDSVKEVNEKSSITATEESSSSSVSSAITGGYQQLLSETPPKSTADISATAADTPSLPVLERFPQNFTYDREAWNRNDGPRVVFLAGPHKTASSTIQEFVTNLAGLTVNLTNTTSGFNGKFHLKPHPSNKDWVWPVGVSSEYLGEDSLMGGAWNVKHAYKFYAALASYLTGRRLHIFNPRISKSKTRTDREKARGMFAAYTRGLFRQPWDDGKKIVIGAEAFDGLTLDLGNPSRYHSELIGEAVHVDRYSSKAIDDLLDLLPWDNGNTTAASDGGDPPRKNPPLRMEDIEVQINIRTPRLKHVISLWHQLGHARTLRLFLSSKAIHKTGMYQLNSLALALQFVRKGIKTTIIDMKGVTQKDSKNRRLRQAQKWKEIDDEAVVGGLRGVVACDILRMGKDGELCDDQSQLHLTGYEVSTVDQNKKDDSLVKALTTVQLQQIERVYDAYDCSVWQHLQKYQASGLLRVLYPSEDLFSTCDPTLTGDISFRDAGKKVQAIAQQENGMPKEEDLKIQEVDSARKKQNQKEKNRKRKERLAKRKRNQSKNSDSGTPPEENSSPSSIDGTKKEALDDEKEDKIANPSSTDGTKEDEPQ